MVGGKLNGYEQRSVTTHVVVSAVDEQVARIGRPSPVDPVDFEQLPGSWAYAAPPPSTSVPAATTVATVTLSNVRNRCFT
ncbi:hypothetical protein Lfu02_00470 [Longispora fulva]|nr:hypothetical protein Lfu02_00470 [Longispora fulva]